MRNSSISWWLMLFITVLFLFLFTANEIRISKVPPTVVYIEVQSEPIELIPSNNFMSYIGEFDVTAYCSCKLCCGRWAENRPVINQREVVFTASGSIAEEGVTVAVDPQVIPYGTKIYIEGLGARIAQDTGGLIKNNRLDVYYHGHDSALRSGLNDRPRKVWKISEGVELLRELN